MSSARMTERSIAMAAPRIRVNARFTRQRVTGVERYALELTSRLSTLEGLIAPRGNGRGPRGHVWEQVVLPHRLGGALLWSPCNTGPLLVANQVVTIHDCAFVDHAESCSPAFSRWYRWLIPRLARRVRRIITVSNYSQQRLAEFTGVKPDKIEVIYNGVDPRFKPVDANTIEGLRRRLGLPPRYVLAVGSLAPRKNLLRLFEAWRQLRLPGDDVKLVVAGTTTHTLRQAGWSDLPESVQLLGYVPDEDLPALYCGAQLFVFPSLYEGFGLPILEAMGCGVPVVCSRTTSLPEVAGDAALLFDPNDPEAIGEAICKVLADPGLQVTLSSGGRTRAAEFTWDRSAKQTWQVLVEAANITRGTMKAGSRP